jgi:hypothetical protein
MLNRKLKDGYSFPLPQGLVLHKPKFQIDVGIVSVCGDIDYTPPKKFLQFLKQKPIYKNIKINY